MEIVLTIINTIFFCKYLVLSWKKFDIQQVAEGLSRYS